MTLIHKRARRVPVKTFLCTFILCALLLSAVPACALEASSFQTPAASDVARAAVYDFRGGKTAFEITDRDDIGRLQTALLAAGMDPAVREDQGLGIALTHAVWLQSKNGAQFEYYVDGGTLLPHLPSGGMRQGSHIQELSALLESLMQRYAPTVDAMQLTPDGESLPRTKVNSLHLYQNADKTFAALDGAGITEIAALLEKLSPAAISADAVTDLGPALNAPDNMAVYGDDIKLTYAFYQNGMAITTETTKGWDIPPKRLAFSGTGYQELIEAVQRLYQASDKGSYWLGLIRPDRMKQATLHSRFFNEDRQIGTDPHLLDVVAQELKGLHVAGESYQKITGGKWQDNADYEFILKFDGNITYTITIAAGQLQVYSNDVGYATRHNLANAPALTEIRKMLSWDPTYDAVRRNPGT